MDNSNSKTKIFKLFNQTDVAYAALGARLYAEEIGFLTNSQYMISTAVSELAHNIIAYAKEGTIQLNVLDHESKKGMEVVAEDFGPGIQDVGKAMQDEFSTGDTLGVGLPGTKRLMDYFEIDTHPGHGTKIVIRKWI